MLEDKWYLRKRGVLGGETYWSMLGQFDSESAALDYVVANRHLEANEEIILVRVSFRPIRSGR